MVDAKKFGMFTEEEITALNGDFDIQAESSSDLPIAMLAAPDAGAPLAAAPELYSAPGGQALL